MREAIEKVIAELESKQLEADHIYDGAKGLDEKNYHDGKGDGIELALYMLKEVLKTESNTKSEQHAPES